LQSKGPLLFAANHPNSFLDGMILTTLLEEPLYSLARGDAFKKGWINKFLRSIKLLPVYRTSEGVENLEHNYTTFAACQKVFKKGGIVLIFSEGRCENEWHLRPLKKGTARLALSSWQQGIPLTVIPLGFNYSSFKRFGKEVHLLFGEPITAQQVVDSEGEGKQMLLFNTLVNQQLKELVYEIEEDDRQTVKKLFGIKRGTLFYAFLLPAFIGAILHAPLFYAVKVFTNKYFKQSGHYDSVLHSLLLIFYPFYLVALFCLFSALHVPYTFLVFFISPLTIWAFVRVKC